MIPVDDKDFYKEIGERFKVFRDLLGLTPQQLAANLETTAQEIIELESGIINPDFFFPSLYCLGLDFDLNIDWIICGTGQIFSYKQDLDYQMHVLDGDEEI